MLKMIDIRYDKQYRPNRIDFASDTWDLANDPITTDTMKGYSLRLMRKYHNRIKKEVINQAFNDLVCKRGDEGVTVLDIGSGRGGDSNKYRKYSGGVFVEPNIDYIPELQRRLSLSFKQDSVFIINNDNFDSIMIKDLSTRDRVIIVNTGGEDVNLITSVVNSFLGGQADVVSMMLSMSFFWGDRNLFDLLMQTIINNISTDGQFIYLTIDGDIVQQAFDPAFGDGIISDQWSNQSGKLRYYSNENRLDITYTGTIVEEQTEWLVRLNDMSFTLGSSNMILSTKNRADQELFLSSFGKTLSSLYTYGRMLKLT